MNPQLRTLYRQASDFLTYTKLYAPDFPPRDELNCKKAICRVFEFLDAIDEYEQEASAKQWLRVCREEVKNAEALFEQEQHSHGRRALASARDYLDNAAHRKSAKPSFIAGETGSAQDLGSGFPS